MRCLSPTEPSESSGSLTPGKVLFRPDSVASGASWILFTLSASTSGGPKEGIDKHYALFLHPVSEHFQLSACWGMTCMYRLHDTNSSNSKSPESHYGSQSIAVNKSVSCTKLPFPFPFPFQPSPPLLTPPPQQQQQHQQ